MGHTNGKLGPNFLKSRRHVLKLNITCSIFNSVCVRKSLPSPSLSPPTLPLPLVLALLLHFFSGQDEKVSHSGLPPRHPRTSLPKSESLASLCSFSRPVSPCPLVPRSPFPCTPRLASPNLTHPLPVPFTLSLAPRGSPKAQKTLSCPQHPRWD